ncbi:hypothetical protein EP30_10785 [Bifidobacterium sp. UTCIF-39]|nr:hypothetical protein EP30_10785 [Bifidobacterium sp. UTCIF-39]
MYFLHLTYRITDAVHDRRSRSAEDPMGMDPCQCADVVSELFDVRQLLPVFRTCEAPYSDADEFSGGFPSMQHAALRVTGAPDAESVGFRLAEEPVEFAVRSHAADDIGVGVEKSSTINECGRMWVPQVSAGSPCGLCTPVWV